MNTAKNALLESFVIDQNPETAIVIDHVNSLLAKKSIKPKATLEIIDLKLNRVLEQTSKIPETKRQSVHPVQTNSKVNSNGISNLTKNVNPEIRPKPPESQSRRSTIQLEHGAKCSEKRLSISKFGLPFLDLKKQTRTTTIIRMRTNSNANKFDNTYDFKVIKSRWLIITPKAQIGDIDSLLLRNQFNSLFKDAKLTIVVNTVEKFKTGQNIVLTTSPDNTAEDLLNNKSIWEHLFDPRTV